MDTPLRKATPLLACLMLTGLALGAPHGGTYRGPGSTVPPGGTGGGPSTPVGPGGSAVTDWRVWWSFNRDPYLRIKEAIQGRDSRTGDDEFFLGFGQHRHQAAGRPPEDELRNRVVPALIRSLRSTENQDLITACLMALAKIGLDGTETDVEALITSFLSDANQEIAETAAVALGIMGKERSAQKLTALLDDTDVGRDLVGRDRVPYRTRSFAAYGLGLLGSQSERQDVRSFAVFHLAHTLETEKTPTHDLATACLISLGIVPLELGNDWPAPDEKVLRINSSRENQIAWILRWFSKSKAADSVRLHAPVAMARLAVGAGVLPKRAVSFRLLEELADQNPGSRDVQRGTVIALGRLGDDDLDDVDGRIRDKLRKLFNSKDAMTRDLARVALARVATRPGQGPEAGSALEPIKKWFIKDLAKGRSTTRPWTALSLGILAFRRYETRNEVSTSVTFALRESLRDAGNPRDAGALCTALGLARDQESVELLLKRVGRGSEDNVRASAAVALGQIGHTDGEEVLAQLVRDSINKPILVREVATGLALMRSWTILPELIEALKKARTLPTQSALTFAIGRVGDSRAVAPLIDLLEDDDLPETTRAFGAAALGVVGDDLMLPWNSKFAVDLHYGLPPSTLTDGVRGILDLL